MCALHGDFDRVVHARAIDHMNAVPFCVKRGAVTMTVHDKQDILLVRLDHRVELLFVLFGPPIAVWLGVNGVEVIK